MQAIKINIEQAGTGYEFTTGSKAVATIRKDVNGAFWARFQMFASAKPPDAAGCCRVHRGRNKQPF